LIFEGTTVGALRYSNAVTWIADAHRSDRKSFVTHADRNRRAFSGTGISDRALRQLSAPALHLPTLQATRYVERPVTAG